MSRETVARELVKMAKSLTAEDRGDFKEVSKAIIGLQRRFERGSEESAFLSSAAAMAMAIAKGRNSQVKTLAAEILEDLQY